MEKVRPALTACARRVAVCRPTATRTKGWNLVLRRTVTVDVKVAIAVLLSPLRRAVSRSLTFLTEQPGGM
ncbi:hypothetical protein GCM10020229_55170 [Kitasatospora albolonga]